MFALWLSGVEKKDKILMHYSEDIALTHVLYTLSNSQESHLFLVMRCKIFPLKGSILTKKNVFFHTKFFYDEMNWSKKKEEERNIGRTIYNSVSQKILYHIQLYVYMAMWWTDIIVF